MSASNGIRVAVVGAGISGLAAAHRLVELAAERRAPLELVVLEAAARVGGLIRTERDDGLLLEAGPDQFVTHKPAAVELCRRVGLAAELIEPAPGRPASQILFRGRLHDLPRGMVGMVPVRPFALLRARMLSWRGRLRAACEPWIPADGAADDESLARFVRRRWGAELLERLAEPMLAGIFVAHAESLSVEAALPRLRALERLHGSVTRGLAGSGRGRGPAFASLAGGLARLPERLAELLPPGAIETGTRVRGLARLGRAWRIEVERGAALVADAVVLACPAWAAARLVREADERLAAGLAATSYASCVTINLVYPRRLVGRPPQGAGFFVARGEGVPLLACSHVSLKFPGRVGADRLLLRAFAGGPRDPQALSRPDSELVLDAGRSLAGLLDLRGPAELARVHRFRKALPQLEVGSPARLARLRARLEAWPGLGLCGGAAGAVGIPDCVALAEGEADRLFEAAWAARARAPLLASGG